MQVEKGRVGQYFIFVGVILLIIFFSIDPGAPPLFGFFFWGIVLIGLGLYLIRRDWKKPPPSGRFRLLRKLRRQPKDNANEEPKNDV
ncbi:MAG: hypothetical protein R6V73_04435 [Anaerolineales bacterium]|jgi:hypothetical protein